MKIRRTRAILLYVFRHRQFDLLAADEAAFQIEQEKKTDTGASFAHDTPSTRASEVRRALVNSFFLVAGTVMVGWITGYYANSFWGPTNAFVNRIFQLGGIGVLLWATLGKQGWNIQTIGGRSLIEWIDGWIYRSLYVIGSYFLVLSVSWSAR